MHEQQLVRPKVAVLLCTYRGQKYLKAQLDSIAAQTHARWVLWASDDGSKDGTCNVLESYAQYWGVDRVHLKSGPHRGYVANFLTLTCHPLIKADYYAYSDQDDIWEPDKLERAVSWLSTVSPDIPALYCSRTRLVDKDNQEMGLSPLFRSPPGFLNALVQNIGGGNTMVFNQAARQLVMRAGPQVRVVSHDWWIYMLVTGCGGRVHYDAHPTIRYRQHADNLIGTNRGFIQKIDRLVRLLRGRYRDWNDTNLAALSQCRAWLTEENKAALDRFLVSRKKWFVPRVFGVWRTGVRRQSHLGNLGILIAALMNKI